MTDVPDISSMRLARVLYNICLAGSANAVNEDPQALFCYLGGGTAALCIPAKSWIASLGWYPAQPLATGDADAVEDFILALTDFTIVQPKIWAAIQRIAASKALDMGG